MPACRRGSCTLPPVYLHLAGLSEAAKWELPPPPPIAPAALLRAEAEKAAATGEGAGAGGSNKKRTNDGAARGKGARVTRSEAAERKQQRKEDKQRKAAAKKQRRTKRRATRAASSAGQQGAARGSKGSGSGALNKNRKRRWARLRPLSAALLVAPQAADALPPVVLSAASARSPLALILFFSPALSAASPARPARC